MSDHLMFEHDIFGIVTAIAKFLNVHGHRITGFQLAAISLDFRHVAEDDGWELVTLDKPESFLTFETAHHASAMAGYVDSRCNATSAGSEFSVSVCATAAAASTST